MDASWRITREALLTLAASYRAMANPIAPG
jgi:hypothetical protein